MNCRIVGAVTTVKTRNEVFSLAGRNKKLLGLFADGAMVPELDREATKEPSLAEMTNAAIDTLSNEKNGFFLMVEGS